MEYETYEVYTDDEDGDDYYVDLWVALECIFEIFGSDCSTDKKIYVFSCADGWHELPDGSMEYGTPAGFEPQLLRTLTIADAIRETGYKAD